MIARLRGELIEREGIRAVVECAGVGYEVHVPECVALELPGLGEPVDLYIRQAFRENEVSLYGFANPHQRRLFDLLTEVKGCGPKIGLSILSALGEVGAAHAIATQDARSLTRASGVGARLAERILVELRDKVQQEMLLLKAGATQPHRAASAQAGNDVIEALLALGYRRSEAEAAALEAQHDVQGVEAQVRAAIRRLSR